MTAIAFTDLVLLLLLVFIFILSLLLLILILLLVLVSSQIDASQLDATYLFWYNRCFMCNLFEYY